MLVFMLLGFLAAHYSLATRYKDKYSRNPLTNCAVKIDWYLGITAAPLSTRLQPDLSEPQEPRQLRGSQLPSFHLHWVLE